MNKITLFQFDTPIWYPILFRPTFIVYTQSSKVSPIHKTGNKTSTTDTFYYVYKQRPQTNKGYHITFLYTHCRLGLCYKFNVFTFIPCWCGIKKLQSDKWKLSFAYNTKVHPMSILPFRHTFFSFVDRSYCRLR